MNHFSGLFIFGIPNTILAFVFAIISIVVSLRSGEGQTKKAEDLLNEKKSQETKQRNEVSYCKYCGKQLNGDEKFCKHCGGKIKWLKSNFGLTFFFRTPKEANEVLRMG